MSFSNKALLEAKPVLPRSVYVRGGALYYVSFEKATQKQRWYRLGTEWNSESKRIWSDLVVRHRSGAHSSRLIYSEGDGPIPLKFLREQLANAKKNAKSRNLECTMTPLHCPFCGCTAVNVHEGSSFRWLVAECNMCGAQCGEVRRDTMKPSTPEEDEAAAIAEWNRRAVKFNGLAELAANRGIT